MSDPLFIMFLKCNSQISLLALSSWFER